VQNSTASYTAVAITLHWVIAAAILGNLGLGLWMHEAIHEDDSRELAIEAYQLHKSMGLCILVLSLLRLAWRYLFPPPPLPAHMPTSARALASLTHWAFYVLMIGIPLSGWLYVSAQWRGDAPLNVPTLWFGLFEVPHLFAVNEAAGAFRQQLAAATAETHEVLAFSLLGLLVLHVVAALRHQFVKQDGVLARMLPWLQSPERPLPALTPARPLAALTTVVIAALFIAYATTAHLRTGEKPETASAMSAVLAAMEDETTGAAPVWQVLPAGSGIGFSGSHVRKPFQGSFKTWLAEIRFDPQQPEQSRILAVIDTASATDGVPLHDSTLPQDEWFDVAKHPYATFRSTSIKPLGEDRFAIVGTLTIKRHSVTIPTLVLTLSGDALEIAGQAEVDRADFNMGMSSDPDGQYVSRNIGISIKVIATPTQ